MTKEDYDTYSECLIYLQLEAMDKYGLLNYEGEKELISMKLNANWGIEKTDAIIRKFIERYEG